MLKIEVHKVLNLYRYHFTHQNVQHQFHDGVYCCLYRYRWHPIVQSSLDFLNPLHRCQLLHSRESSYYWFLNAHHRYWQFLFQTKMLHPHSPRSPWELVSQRSHYWVLVRARSELLNCHSKYLITICWPKIEKCKRRAKCRNESFSSILLYYKWLTIPKTDMFQINIPHRDGSLANTKQWLIVVPRR